ncbi:MAG TPA: sulfite exporter TauE/SafE family protein [Methylomirabilota bacterium]|nr:sulfite exporter TauE/SafE family protein [Methylomirabilota bacterium]
MLSLGPALGVFVGGVSFGFAGFAFALFATMALALDWPPRVVIPAVMLIADTLTVPLLWEHRAHLRRDALREAPPFAPWSAPLLVAGIGVGTLMLGRVSAAVGRLAVALVVLAFVSFQVTRPMPRGAARPLAHPWTPAGVGFLGGFLDGWLGTGGAAVAAYLTWRRFTAGPFITALLAYFVVTDLLRVVAYAASGYWTADTLGLYLRVVPIALAGYVSGVALRHFLLPARAFRAAVLFLLTVYGLALIARVLSGH